MYNILPLQVTLPLFYKQSGVPKEGDKKLKEKNAQNGMKPGLSLDEITAATRGYVCGRHSLISCISSFSFQLTNSQRITQLHTISIVFYFPHCGLLWLKYISYLSWKQQREMSLSVRRLVQRDGIEPRTLFSRLQS